MVRVHDLKISPSLKDKDAFASVTAQAVTERATPQSTPQPFYAVIFFFIWFIAFFSRRETCACDMPTSFATSICVRPS